MNNRNSLQTAAAVERLAVEGALAVLDRATALRAAGRSVINLGIGQPDFATPAHIVEAGVKALQDGHHGYTPAGGIPALREAVADDIAARRGAQVDPDDVLVVPGGKMAITFAIMMFGEPGAEILYPDPGFPIYRSAIDYTGATGVPIPHTEANGFAFDAAAVLAQITPASRLLILNSPSNPTGGVTPRAEVDRLVAGLAGHPHVAVLSDEIYSRIVYDDAAHVSLLEYPEMRDRVIMLDGWSKTFAMTGWRLGYAVWPQSLINAAKRLAINFHSCVNASAQFAGVAALTGPQQPVDDMVAAFAARRRTIVDALNALPGVACATPGGAFYAFPNITDTGWSADALADALLEETGVAVLGGGGFGAMGEGYLRVSYADSEENLNEAAARISQFLAARPAPN